MNKQTKKEEKKYVRAQHEAQILEFNRIELKAHTFHRLKIEYISLNLYIWFYNHIIKISTAIKQI